MVHEEDEAPLLPGLHLDGYGEPSEAAGSDLARSASGEAQPFLPLPPQVSPPATVELPSFLHNDRETLEEPRVPADYVTERCFDYPLFTQPELPWETGNVAYVFGLRKDPPLYNRSRLEPWNSSFRHLFARSSLFAEQPLKSSPQSGPTTLTGSSPLTYSRDEATRLAALVHGILDLIRGDVL